MKTFILIIFTLLVSVKLFSQTIDYNNFDSSTAALETLAVIYLFHFNYKQSLKSHFRNANAYTYDSEIEATALIWINDHLGFLFVENLIDLKFNTFDCAYRPDILDSDTFHCNSYLSCHRSACNNFDLIDQLFRFKCIHLRFGSHSGRMGFNR